MKTLAFYIIKNKKTVFRNKDLFQKKYAIFLNKNFIVKFDIDLDQSFQNISQPSILLSQIPIPEDKIKTIKKKVVHVYRMTKFLEKKQKKVY